MKVLFFASTDDSLGGAKSLLEMVTRLKQKGIEIIVVNPARNKLNDKLDKIGIENYAGGYHLNICKKDCSGFQYLIKLVVKYVRYILFQVRGIIRLSQVIRFEEIDIIHTNNSVEDIGAFFARKYHIPHIWHIREFGDLDFNFQYFHKEMGKYISKNADRIITISSALTDAWVKKGIDENKIVKITHGVDANTVDYKKSREDGCIRIVFAGALVPEKGQLTFIEAIREMSEEEKKQFHLYLYGTGSKDYTNTLKSAIEKNGLENIVSICGYNSNLSHELYKFDVGIVNSRCEAMGRVTIEYMLAGLCVMASNTGANPEILENGKLGFLFDYGNMESIRQCLCTLLSNHDDLNNMKVAARECALEKYDINKNVNKFVTLYESIHNRYVESLGANNEYKKGF